MSHLNYQKSYFEYLNICCFFFCIDNMSYFRMGIYVCASQCLLLCLLSLYVKLVEHCNDLRINCSEF